LLEARRTSVPNVRIVPISLKKADSDVELIL